MANIEVKKPTDLADTPNAGDPVWASGRTILVGFVVGGAFLLLAFRKVSIERFVDTLQTANSHLILLGIVFYGLYLVARASRWRLLLAERTATLPFAVLFRAVTWGTAANAIIPHSGEVLRTFVARKPLKVSASAILGTIAAERFYDFATVTVLTGAALLFFQDPPPILRTALVAICAMGFALLIGLLLLGFKYPPVIALLNLVTKPLQGKCKKLALDQVDELSSGIRAAFSGKRLGWIGLLSACQWLCVTGCIYVSIESFGISLSPWLAFIVLPLTIAGLTLPTAPVYLGTIQMCFLAGLTPFGVSNEVAIAASVAYLGITTIPIILVSLVWYLQYVLVGRKAI